MKFSRKLYHQIMIDCHLTEEWQEFVESTDFFSHDAITSTTAGIFIFDVNAANNRILKKTLLLLQNTHLHSVRCAISFFICRIESSKEKVETETELKTKIHFFYTILLCWNNKIYVIMCVNFDENEQVVIVISFYIDLSCGSNS